jgi:hypothetical protein
MPVLMGLGVGISLNNAKAVLEAIWGAIRKKPSEFVRTPKYGVTGKARQNYTRSRQDAANAQATPDELTPAAPQPPNFLTLKRLALPIIEIAFGGYMASCIWISVWYLCGLWPGQTKSGIASLPFLFIFAGGYLYVGMASVFALWKMQMDAHEEFVEAPEIAGL